MRAQLSTLFSRISNPTIRYGVMWGIPLGILQVALIVLAGFLPDLENLLLNSSLGFLPLILFVVFAFFASRAAAQATQKLSTGILAGLLTSVIGFLLVGLTSFTQTLIFIQDYVNYYRTHPASGVNPSVYTSSYVLISTMTGLLESLIFYALLAIIGGVIGSFLGKRRSYAQATNQVSGQEVYAPPVTPEQPIVEQPIVEQPIERRTEQPASRTVRTIHRAAKPRPINQSIPPISETERE